MVNVNNTVTDAVNRIYGNEARIDYLEQQIMEVRGQDGIGVSLDELKFTIEEEITRRVVDEVTNIIMKKIEDCVVELNQQSPDKEFITDIERLLLACQQ